MPSALQNRRRAEMERHQAKIKVRLRRERRAIERETLDDLICPPEMSASVKHTPPSKPERIASVTYVPPAPPLKATQASELCIQFETGKTYAEIIEILTENGFGRERTGHRDVVLWDPSQLSFAFRKLGLRRYVKRKKLRPRRKAKAKRRTKPKCKPTLVPEPAPASSSEVPPQAATPVAQDRQALVVTLLKAESLSTEERTALALRILEAKS